MRLSIDRDDPGFEAYCRVRSDGKRPRIYLDGIERRHVRTADDEEGIIVATRYTDDGNIMIDVAREEVMYETLRGDVRIVID